MTDATISFSSPNQIPVLFGAHDRYLRRVREAVGVEVTLRGDELRLQGSGEQVERALEVFAELRSIIERRGELLDSDVQHALHEVARNGTNGKHAPGNGTSRRPEVEESINLFEKARRVLPRSPGQAEYVRAI